ncbi:MAG: hypothetical protein ACD_39C00698G0002 [uncultured bacterium]|nr:MAG: hypothetical protein ACD_39C00698G0002 [uncultured bacterium]
MLSEFSHYGWHVIPEWLFDRKDEKVKNLIARHQLNRIPALLVLALAPNGVITGVYMVDRARYRCIQIFVPELSW